MLKDFVKAEKPQDEELKQRIREAGEKLAAQRIRSRNIRFRYLF